MNKIRILHCIETISSGGVEVLRLGFAKHFDKDRFELQIVCTNAKGPIKDGLEEEGVRIFQVGQFKSPLEFAKYKKTLRIVKDFSPQIIHGAVFEGMCMASICGYLGKVPVIILEETSDPQKRSRKAIWLQRQLARFSDLVIGISPSVTEYLIQKAKIPSNKVFLLNNAVDSENCLSKGNKHFQRETIGLSHSDFVLGSVGRIHDEVKRYSDVLKALKLLNNPNIKFLLIGDGPDLDKLKILAEELGLEKQFIPIGFKVDTSTYYKMMDCFCIPSEQEGFGMVAVEAMFHQLPVIASSVGGLKDVVLNRVTGMLIPPRSPECLANSTEFFLDHPEERLKMGKEGFLRASKLYGIAKYTQTLEKLYLSFI